MNRIYIENNGCRTSCYHDSTISADVHHFGVSSRVCECGKMNVPEPKKRFDQYANRTRAKIRYLMAHKKENFLDY